MNKKWTKEEEQYLKDNYNKLSIKDINNKLSRTINSIQKKAHTLKLTHTKKFSFSESEFLDVIKISKSHREACIKLGYLGSISSIKISSRSTLYSKFFQKLKPDISHFNLHSRATINKNGNTVEAFFNNTKKHANKRKLKFSLSIEDFTSIVLAPCYYCGCVGNNNGTSYKGKIKNKFSGIDRIDNNIGYIKNNCVPCCKYCNFSKRERTQSEFFKHIKQIYKHLNLESWQDG